MKNELNPVQEKYVQTYFEQEVRPRLVPIMLNSHPSFPYLKNTVIYLAIRLARDKEPEQTAFALIEIPVNIMPRFVVLPKVNQKNYTIMLDDIIRYGLKDIFAIFNYDTHEAYTIKLTRDAELDIDDDVTKSFF